MLATGLFPLSALANKSGLAGYSGKPNLSAPAGESCNKCHSGGTAPQVTLTGPATLTAGQVADYSLVVTTGASRAAGAIAATDGIVLTPVTGLRDSFGEMVPNGGVATAGGSATFAFRVTAPLTGTTLRLWAVGLAENGNNGDSGDKATHLVRDVAVTGGTPPKPDAGGSSSGDASVDPPTGADGGSSGGSSGSSGSSSGSSGGASGSSSGSSGSSGSSSGDDGADPGAPASSSGGGGEGASCSSSPSSGVRGQGTIGVVLAALGVIQLVAARRRRRRA
ncbi:MAG TPA: choice-of-anchor V domain-containing protein [Labilithrix sp.]|nr:choice-of-anchor V domain-containing protein [Labilithrix sp.]